MKKDQTRPVRFLLGDERRELSAIDPNMTVLNYLRRVERRVGTKEGCGEGDCGACTVVVGEPDDNGGVDYRAVNSCIQFVGALDGKQLLTVEDLAAADGTLHPCQQALVDCHGSQCGFCTPGFVMSLFALYQEGGTPNRNRIDDALAGNLCRCTGYGPIAAAAKVMKAAGPDRFARGARQTIAALKALDGRAMPCLEADSGSYFAPRSVDSLARLLMQHPGATILAGGTDVGLWVTKQLRRLGPIISVGAVEELKRVTVDDRWIEIGAAGESPAALERIVRQAEARCIVGAALDVPIHVSLTIVSASVDAREGSHRVEAAPAPR